MTTESSAKVLDFASFKSRKISSGERKESLSDAFQVQNMSEKTHTTNISSLSASSKTSVSNQANVGSKGEPDLHERIERIKASIGRINALMAELRQDKK